METKTKTDGKTSTESIGVTEMHKINIREDESRFCYCPKMPQYKSVVGFRWDIKKWICTVCGESLEETTK